MSRVPGIIVAVTAPVRDDIDPGLVVDLRTVAFTRRGSRDTIAAIGVIGLGRSEVVIRRSIGSRR